MWSKNSYHWEICWVGSPSSTVSITWLNLSGVRYEEDNDFRLFCGQVDSLSFWPPDEVQEGMEHLRSIMPDESAPLIEYFDLTYVTGALCHRCDNRLPHPNGVIPSLRKWNMHQVTLDNQPRIKNIFEAWKKQVCQTTRTWQIHLFGVSAGWVFARADCIIQRERRGRRRYMANHRLGCIISAEIELIGKHQF